MNAHTIHVTGAPHMSDGRIAATMAEAWFDPARSGRIAHLAARIERLRGKAADRLAVAHSELDEALAGHPLEARLRAQLLQPLERDCAELAQVFKRVHTRLALFAPTRSQAQFEDGLALQFDDLRAAQATPEKEEAEETPRLPFGYWMSEESFNRIERACSASHLLSSMGDGVGERMAVSFDAVAASVAYVHEDLAAALAGATHTTKLGGDDE